MALNVYSASAQELRTLEGVGEKKAAKIINLRDTQDVTEENLAAEIQLPVETIQQWVHQNKLSLKKLPMSLPTQQEDSGVSSEPTSISTEARLSKLETIIIQLGQSVQSIAEDMKSLKDSTLAEIETVQEVQQDRPTQDSDKMVPDTTNKQQHRAAPINQQAEINKLLHAIPSDGVYHSAVGGAIPKVNTDDIAFSNMNYQKTSTPITSSSGKPARFPSALRAMSPLKPMSSMLNAGSAPFIPSTGSLQATIKQSELNNGTQQIPDATFIMSTMPSTSVASSAPTVCNAARTTVGPMAPVAVNNQNKSSKRRKRNQYRSTSSSSSDIDVSEFQGSSVNTNEHSGERCRGRSRSKSPTAPKMSIFKGTDSPSWEAFIYQFERTAARRQWSNDKKLSRLLDCLGDVALEYTHRVNAHNEYNTLKKYLKRRFSTKEAPVVARRQLPFLKQQEHETLEEFSQRVYSLTLDAYEECEGDIIEEMAVETFLRGCKEKSAARHAMAMEPRTIHKAFKFVKTALANDRALFGGRSSAYYHRQVTFQDETKKTTESPDKLQNQIDSLTKAIETLNTKLSMTNRYSGADGRQERVRSPSPALRGRSPRRFSDSSQNYKLMDRSQSPSHLPYSQQDRSASPKYHEKNASYRPFYQQHETHSQSRASSLSPVKGGSAKNEDLNIKGPGRQA